MKVLSIHIDNCTYYVLHKDVARGGARGAREARALVPPPPTEPGGTFCPSRLTLLPAPRNQKAIYTSDYTYEVVKEEQ